ncbi:class I SAM-dependent methyltransferase [Nonomuraea sp. NPDC003754]
MQDAEFNDPRLVAVYDAMYTWGRDDDFFLAVVGETPAARVLDLGCGTGRLALGMAAAGHTVTGVDPARASLEAARAKPGAERVTWIEGTADVLPERAFDVAVMTSHVAQVFVDDEEWKRVLAALERSLVPGGRLVFDSRDPRNLAWERWNPTDSRQLVRLPDGAEAETWVEVTDVQDGRVSFTYHYAFSNGETLLSTSTLRFRTEEELRASLAEAGFRVERIHGGWHRQPVGEGDGEFLIIART